MTSLILKALRPIVVPLLVEAMEQRDRNRPENQNRVYMNTSIAKGIADIVNGDLGGRIGKDFGGGPARY